MGSKKIVKRSKTGDFLERGEGRQEVYRKDTKAGKKKKNKKKKQRFSGMKLRFKEKSRNAYRYTSEYEKRWN